MGRLELALTQTYRIHLTDAFGHLRHTVFERIDDDDALVGVHEQHIVGLDHLTGASDVNQRRNFERTRQNGRVRCGRALFDDQTRDGNVLTAFQNQNIGRAEVFGHQNDRTFAHHARNGVGRTAAAAQNALYALNDLCNVVDTIG